MFRERSQHLRQEQNWRAEAQFRSEPLEANVVTGFDRTTKGERSHTTGLNHIPGT